MRMSRSRVDFQTVELDVAHAVGREHAAHGALDEALGVLVLDLPRGLDFEAARISAVTVVDFVVPLFTAEFDFVRVDHDDVIAVVDVRCPGRFVFARERTRDAHRQRSEALSGGVDDVPIVLGLGGLLLVGPHNRHSIREFSAWVKDFYAEI